MYPLVFSAIATLTIYLIHSLTKHKQKVYVYVILFTGLTVIDYAFDYAWKANAQEFNLKSHLLLQAEVEKREDKKKKPTRRKVHEKYLKVCEE